MWNWAEGCRAPGTNSICPLFLLCGEKSFILPPWTSLSSRGQIQIIVVCFNCSQGLSPIGSYSFRLNCHYYEGRSQFQTWSILLRSGRDFYWARWCPLLARSSYRRDLPQLPRTIFSMKCLRGELLGNHWPKPPARSRHDNHPLAWVISQKEFPIRNTELTSCRQLEEFSRGQKEGGDTSHGICQHVLPTSQKPSSWNPSQLRDDVPPGKALTQTNTGNKQDDRPETTQKANPTT